MRRHPGRVERVGRVSGKRSPALGGALPCPHHLTRRGRARVRVRRAGWQTARGSARLSAVCWSIDSEVVAMTSPRAGRGAPSARPGRWCDRVRVSGWRWLGGRSSGREERDEERGTGRRTGSRRERADAIRAKDGRETRAKDDRNQQTEDRREEGTGEGVNDEAAEGRRGRRHPSPWFSLFVCCPFRSPFCLPRSFFLFPSALSSFRFLCFFFSFPSALP